MGKRDASQALVVHPVVNGLMLSLALSVANEEVKLHDVHIALGRNVRPIERSITRYGKPERQAWRLPYPTLEEFGTWVVAAIEGGSVSTPRPTRKPGVVRASSSDPASKPRRRRPLDREAL